MWEFVKRTKRRHRVRGQLLDIAYTAPKMPPCGGIPPPEGGQLAPALVNRTFFVFVAIFGVAGVFHLRTVAVHALAAQLANVVAGQPTGAFVVKVVTSCHLFILPVDYI